MWSSQNIWTLRYRYVLGSIDTTKLPEKPWRVWRRRIFCIFAAFDFQIWEHETWKKKLFNFKINDYLFVGFFLHERTKPTLICRCLVKKSCKTCWNPFWRIDLILEYLSFLVFLSSWSTLNSPYFCELILNSAYFVAIIF